MATLHPTPLLRIPGDLAASPGSKLLQAGELCFGEYHQAIRQKPRNVFVTEHTLIFVVKGAKVFRFPDSEFVVEAGKALFLKRGCYLLCESIEQNNVYESISMFFNESVLRNFWLSLDLANSKKSNSDSVGDTTPMVVLKPSDALDDFRDRIIQSLSSKQEILEPLMISKLQELLLLLLKSQSAADLIQFFDGLYPENLPDPLYTVSQNLLAPLSLLDYARLCCRSLSKFKRDFRDQTGKSPGKWINAKRLEQAHLLVKSTNLSVGEICTRSGFNNVSHFIRSYKAAYQSTPAGRANRSTKSTTK